MFSLRNKFYITYRQQDREQTMLEEGRQDKRWCTGRTFNKVTGVQLCADVSLPPVRSGNAPWFPLTGPASASISMQKKDTFEAYMFQYRFTKVRSTCR